MLQCIKKSLFHYGVLNMTELKETVAKNIIDLRRKRNVTQAELAEALNYSDKAVSKWERAESLPDISVLKNIADFFAVTVDYLISDTHPDLVAEKAKLNSRRLKNRAYITGISIFLVLFIAAFVYTVGTSITGGIHYWWLSFVYALPVSFIVWLVVNSIWFNSRRNFLIISLLIWSSLLSIYITLLTFNINLWLIFILGLIGQAIVLLWSRIRRSDKRNK